MREFQEDIRNFQPYHCPHCKERWFTRADDKDEIDCLNKCKGRLKRFNSQLNKWKVHAVKKPTKPVLKWSKENFTVPEPIPSELPGVLFC